MTAGGVPVDDKSLSRTGIKTGEGSNRHLRLRPVRTALAVGLPLGVVVFVFAATLNGIAKVALYEYATTDEPPRYFENVDFDVGGDGSRRQTPTEYVRGRI